MRHLVYSYLQIRNHFTEGLSKEPGLGDVHNQCGWEAGDGHEHVSQRKVDDEVVGHCPHVVVLPHGHTN